MHSQLKATSYYLCYRNAARGHCSVVQDHIQTCHEQQTRSPGFPLLRDNDVSDLNLVNNSSC